MFFVCESFKILKTVIVILIYHAFFIVNIMGSFGFSRPSLNTLDYFEYSLLIVTNFTLPFEICSLTKSQSFMDSPVTEQNVSTLLFHNALLLWLDACIQTIVLSISDITVVFLWCALKLSYKCNMIMKVPGRS
jgi:hypothetical protein